MSDLRTQLQEIANQFVSSILFAMSTASLSDLAGQSNGAPSAPAPRGPGTPRGTSASSSTNGTKAGRRKRSSAAEVQILKDAALAAAKSLKPGFSKADVMKKSGGKFDLGRALSLLVDDGKLTKKGDRRKTRYWVK